MHTLAEPNLTAVSGETAKFLAGGEFPVPAGRDQQGNISVIFKHFGVGPVLHAGGAERQAHLAAAVDRSERTDQHRRLHARRRYGHNSQGQAITVQAQTIPALEVRRAETDGRIAVRRQLRRSPA